MTHRSTSNRSAADALAHVTGEISRLLEQGVMPWRAPWDQTIALAATPGLPLRSTGQPYRGANVVLLWAAQIARGYAKRTWITFRQALAVGAHVRKGEKACPVIYYGQAAAQNDAEHNATDVAADIAKTYRFLKVFHVFNADQIEGLPEDFAIEPLAPAPRAPLTFEAWAERAGARVRIGGTSAFYAPATDTIQIPPIEAFADPEQWNATLSHEAVHFTGHRSRLDRLQDYATDRKARAREELIAEIGSAVLGAMVGFRPDHLESHAAYISSWLELVRDPRAFFTAAAKAQAAVDWLITRAGLPTDLDAGNRAA